MVNLSPSENERTFPSVVTPLQVCMGNLTGLFLSNWSNFKSWFSSQKKKNIYFTTLFRLFLCLAGSPLFVNQSTKSPLPDGLLQWANRIYLIPLKKILRNKELFLPSSSLVRGKGCYGSWNLEEEEEEGEKSKCRKRGIMCRGRQRALRRALGISRYGVYTTLYIK